MANISRRNFMKVAAGAAGIAGLGLLNGCSKTEAPASSAAASAAGSGSWRAGGRTGSASATASTAASSTGRCSMRPRSSRRRR